MGGLRVGRCPHCPTTAQGLLLLTCALEHWFPICYATCIISSASMPPHSKSVGLQAVPIPKPCCLRSGLCSASRHPRAAAPFLRSAPAAGVAAVTCVWHVLQFLLGWLASWCCLAHSVGTTLANGLQHGMQRPS